MSVRARTSLLVLSLVAHVAYRAPLGAEAASRPAQEIENRQVESDVARLTQELRSPEDQVRLNAALALTQIRTAAAAPALASALNDPYAAVRAVVVTGLAEMGGVAYTATIAERLAHDKNQFVRKTAAYALGDLRDHGGTSQLARALADSNSEVRGAAAVALGEYRDETAVAPLIYALTDKSDFVRAQAARALGVNGTNAAGSVSALIRILKHDTANEAKRQAATALGLIGDRSSLPPLEDSRRDPDPYLSAAAIEAIERIKQGRL